MSQIKTKYVGDLQITNAKIANGTIDLTAKVTGVLPQGRGGTGSNAYSDGQLLIGNSAGGGLNQATLTAGANVTITNGNGTITIAASTNSPGWTKVTFSHTAFQTAALANTLTLATLPLKTVLHQVMIKQSTAFAGTSITAYNLSVGVSGSNSKYAIPFDVFQAVSDTARSITQVEDVPSYSGSTTLQITATSVGANLSASTAGSVDVWILTSLLP